MSARRQTNRAYVKAGRRQTKPLQVRSRPVVWHAFGAEKPVQHSSLVCLCLCMPAPFWKGGVVWLGAMGY